jgi:hypothetical protein
MAVGHVASATSGSQASVATFNIGTLGTGARAGIVFVATHGTGDLITGVTWNSVAMTRLYRAADTDTEPGSVVAYFLDNVTNGTITVSRTNNAVVTVGYAASVSALGACGATQTITRVSSTQNTNADTSTTGTGASGEVAVDDGSRGTNSLRYAAAYTGAATPVGQGTNSTTLQSLDSTALGSSFVRETNAGQGSRNVGFATGTTDDWALVAVAISEINVTSTGAITGQAATVSGTGSHVTPVTGTGAVALAATTTSGTGVEGFTATGAVTTPASTVSGTGAEVFTATGAISGQAQTVTGTGAEVFTATGAPALPSTTVSGTGDHAEGSVNAEGTGEVSLAAATSSGTGSLGLTATGDVALAALTSSGTGTLVLTGSGAIAISPIVIESTALHALDATGTGAIDLPSLTVSGTGIAPSTGGHGGRGGLALRREPTPIPDADEAYTLLI